MLFSLRASIPFNTHAERHLLPAQPVHVPQRQDHPHLRVFYVCYVPIQPVILDYALPHLKVDQVALLRDQDSKVSDLIPRTVDMRQAGDTLRATL